MTYFKLDPLEENCIESGEIEKEKFKSLYLNFPWIEMLKKQCSAKVENIIGSPGIIIRNKEQREVFVSIVGDIKEYEFYICYKRPTLKKNRKWFKIIEYLDKNHHSIIPQQTLENGLEACLLFFNEDYEKLEKKYG